MRSVCVFSLHLLAQAWNFDKSIIRTQKVKSGWDLKFYPQMYILQTRLQVSDSQIPLSYSSLERSCSEDKTFQKHLTFIFVFSKVIEVYKSLKSGGSSRVSVKENSKIKCICYINNMFSNTFINQAFKSYTSFDFTYAYTCQRFKIFKLLVVFTPWKLPNLI